MQLYRHSLTAPEPVKGPGFMHVYLLSAIFMFQTLLVAYTSSTYLEDFISSEMVGLVYMIGASAAIVLLLLSPKILRAIGNVNFILSLMTLKIVSAIVAGLALSPALTVISFILFIMASPQIHLNLDIFLETLIGDNEGSTGSKRGLINTIIGIAAFISPIVMGYIISKTGSLSSVYFASAVIGLLFVMMVLARFRRFSDPYYTTVKLKDLLASISDNINIKIILYCQFLLQFFFVWATIYIPLYLATEIGLSWDSISKIIAAGLLAYVIFEYPTGKIADERWGEKEMMATGFIVLALSCASITYLNTNEIWPWMVLLFLSRTGVSLAQVTNESYFFKQVNSTNSNIISLFRLARPLANVLGALAGTISLFFLPFNFIFIVLALIMVTGAFSTIKLVDTK